MEGRYRADKDAVEAWRRPRAMLLVQVYPLTRSPRACGAAGQPFLKLKEKVRIDGIIQSQAVLIAIGIN